MGSLKPWQLVLVIIAVLVLAVSLWISVFSGDKIKSASSFYMIDVVTGEVYKANIAGRRSVMVPAKSPTTLVRSIVPLVENDQGQWEVENRFRDTAIRVVDEIGKSLVESIDQNTWVVSTGVDGAETYRYPD